MRIKESLQLDSMIRDRANSLAVQGEYRTLIKRSKVLEALIRCQEELDGITLVEPEEVAPVTNVGDINVNITNPGKGRGNNDSNAPYRPFDNFDTGRQLARELKKELRGA